MNTDVTVRARSPATCVAAIMATGLVLGGCATQIQPPPESVKTAVGTTDPHVAKAGKGLSINMPIGAVAADPAGKAVLQHDLPGLLERPEYAMFKTMSLKALAPLSNGKITAAKLAQVQRDLAGVGSKSGSQR